MARRKLGFWGRFAAIVVIPATNALNKPDWRGREHFPATGPVIVVVNHMSDADPFVIARYVYETGRWPQFLFASWLPQVCCHETRLTCLWPQLRQSLPTGC